MRINRVFGYTLLCISPCAISANLDFAIDTSGFKLDSFNDVAGSSWSQATGGNITVEGGISQALLDTEENNLYVRITTGSGTGNPYFDAPLSGRPGGLGSCQVLTATAQCDPSSDDNLGIVSGESVRLDFENGSGDALLTNLGEFTFRDDDHNEFDGTVVVRTAAGLSGLTALTVTGGAANLSGLGPIEWVQFTSLADVNGAITVLDEVRGDKGYYISGGAATAVPIPAAGWLLGSALLGLVTFARRRH